MPRRLSLAYYCSGHGYGHATRVSAIASHLCSLPDAPLIYIISSAPQLVFQDSINFGARYRYAFIDPVIVQPLAYYVDRRKSVQDLQAFLESKDQKVYEEAAWLKENNINCVLSDAAFLACLAAKSANIPSVLITNFTFDSVYSYLSSPITDSPPLPTPCHDTSLPASNETSTSCHCVSRTAAQTLFRLKDTPIPLSELEPLVHELHSGYRHADLLLLLPGHIPIPSFHANPVLPSISWVDPAKNRFFPEVTDILKQSPYTSSLLPPIDENGSPRQRAVKQAPLVVRHPSPDIYTTSGRARLLNSIGIPPHLHGSDTKILVVSFGGQVFKKPSSRSTSRTGSPVPAKIKFNSDYASPTRRIARRRKVERTDSSSSDDTVPETPDSEVDLPLLGHDNRPGMAKVHQDKDDPCYTLYSHVGPDSLDIDYLHIKTNGIATVGHTPSLASDTNPVTDTPHSQVQHSRLATPHHLLVPGAPPSNRPRTRSVSCLRHRTRELSVGANAGVDITVCAATPLLGSDADWDGSGTPAVSEVMTGNKPPETDEQECNTFNEPSQMLPDTSWIAIVCGASKSSAPNEGEKDTDNDMPERFFTAPRDVYMPDLTAVADVLLGKLGYGTMSECVDACTPFVYVPRPLFIEEHGLRHYLSTHGTGIELSRESYESGDWAPSIEQAYENGREAKMRKRQVGDDGSRRKEVRAMAEDLVEWVTTQGGSSHNEGVW